MRKNRLIAGVLAGSLMVSGCAGTDNGDTAGALLLGAAVIGLGILAATTLNDDDNRDRGDNGDHHRHRENDYSRYANNGRCDDPSYRTSNGGRASPGTDERDCRRYGDGRK